MKILVLLPRFPYPLDKGDKLRAYHQIVELSKRHEIYLFALSHDRVGEGQLQALRPYCKEVRVEKLCRAACAFNVLLSFLKGEPLQLGWWTTGHAKRAFKAFEQKVQPDVLYCQMVRTMPLVSGTPHLDRRRPAGIIPTSKVLDFQDALSLNTFRRMERSHGLMRIILNYEYRALQRAEQTALSLFDATTVIGRADCDAISPDVAIVPNGVDTEYYNIENLKLKTEKTTDTDDVPDISICNSQFSICFTGNMSYAPNVDAARWLVKEIMPLVWSQIRSATLLLAGADPKPAVKALAGPKVVVSGRLDDIRTAYASAKVFVAPMRIGSGMQNKLLEAMSMRLPCVTTSLAATPLGAIAGEHLLVGDTAEELADLIVKLINGEQHCSIADGGHRFVQEHYSWPAAVAPLETILTTNR